MSVNLTPRPVPRSEEILTKAVASIKDQIINWFESNTDAVAEEAEKDIENELLDVVRHNIDFDGYQLARELDEKYMWSADADLVDVLNNFGFHVDKCWRAAVEKWLEENKIKPALSVGSSVQLNQKGEVVSGKIVNIFPETGSYVIQIDGQTYGRPQSGLVIPYENVWTA